jgi:hypothetical protein
LGVGGRYQITQVYFNGQGALGSSGPAVLGVSSDDADSLGALCVAFPEILSFLSPGVVGVAAELVTVLKSKAVPGVFGVLVADPNDANAPDPSPKAEDPAVVGEAKFVLVNGEMALNGFRPPCDELSPPKRFDAENVRVGGSAFSPWDVDSDSLLVLYPCQCVFWSGGRGDMVLGAAGPQVLSAVHWARKWGRNKIYGIERFCGELGVTTKERTSCRRKRWRTNG